MIAEICKCPRCGCDGSIINDAYPGCEEFLIELCLVCGWWCAVNGEECNLPHFNYNYSYSGPVDSDCLDDIALDDIAKKHNMPDVCDLVAVEAWLKMLEAQGYAFSHFVVVDINGEINWLRGNSENWNCGDTRDLRAATFLGKCPRCNCLSVVSDGDPAVSGGCVVCGWYGGAQCEPPHCNFALRDAESICSNQWANLSEIFGSPELNDLAQTEAWIKDYEKSGLEFAYFVLVDIKGEVHWLRGDSQIWSNK